VGRAVSYVGGTAYWPLCDIEGCGWQGEEPFDYKWDAVRAVNRHWKGTHDPNAPQPNRSAIIQP
jgi:hypothetical protein